MSISQAATLLREHSIADPEKLLDEPGRGTLKKVVEQAAKQGLRAHVLLLSAGETLADYHPLWQQLRYTQQQDLLLIFNGQRWEAKGWGLPQPSITRLLEASEAGLPEQVGQALTTALGKLSKEALSLRSSSASSSSSSDQGALGWVLPGAGLVALALGATWIIRRRSALANTQRTAFAQATHNAEQAYGEVMLSAEDLMTDESAGLQLRAAELKRQLDSLVTEVGANTGTMGRQTTLAKVLHIENELAAIRSTILQKARRP